MDSTIIAAIIGGIFAIGASIVTFVVTRIFDNDSLSDTKNARQFSITGRWEGHTSQEGGVLVRKDLDVPLAFSFKSTRRGTQGAGSLSITLQGNTTPTTLNMIVKGKFVYERFLKLEYEFEQPLIQFGFILLELSPDGQTLEGCWMGFGATTRHLIYGTVQLRKQGASLPLPASPQTSV